MLVDSDSYDDYEENIHYLNATQGLLNGKPVHISENQMKHNLAVYVKSICSGNNHFTNSPLSGNANISVQKDSDGSTSIEVSVEHTSEDETFEVKGQASIDDNGNVSGKASVGVNWNKD